MAQNVIDIKQRKGEAFPRRSIYKNTSDPSSTGSVCHWQLNSTNVVLIEQ